MPAAVAVPLARRVGVAEQNGQLPSVVGGGVDGHAVADGGDCQLMAVADAVGGDALGVVDGQVDPGVVGGAAQPGGQPGQAVAVLAGAHRSTSAVWTACVGDSGSHVDRAWGGWAMSAGQGERGLGRDIPDW